MRFRDLLTLEHDLRSNAIRLESLQPHLPDTPRSVLQQVYSDHGRNPQFQSLYGDIEIDRLAWHLASVPAHRLVACSCNEDFRGYMEVVTTRPEAFPEEGWHSIDVRARVAGHWEAHRTWMEPPVFVWGRLLGRRKKYHLVEGHTRVAVLNGLVRKKILQPSSTHEIWFGDLSDKSRPAAKPGSAHPASPRR